MTAPTKTLNTANAENFHRSASAPVGIVAAVSMKTIWNRKYANTGAVYAAEAALAALASESAAGTPCPATTSGHARVISRPRPTERLIQPPSEGSHDAQMLLNSRTNCTNRRTLRYYPIGWCAPMSQ